MISQQFLLSTQQANHPNHHQIRDTPPPRPMKQTLDMQHGSKVKQMTRDEVLDENSYKTKLKQIHTKTVKDTIDKRTANKVLGTRPPEIDQSENILPRKTRSTLCQLRSGYSSFLNNYLPKKSEKEDKCHCLADPTTLTPMSLWKEPRRAAEFLGLELDQPEDS